jgi:ring-1,2-phenylacetyl-CoA epoxidase subunit PaaC
VEYLLRLADDALILSHRLAEWASRAPQIEEDIALTNIGLDLLGQARALLTRAGELETRELENGGRDEDDFAYLREEHEYRSCLLVEQPNRDDFAVAMVRQLLFSAYELPLLESLSRSTDSEVAGIAAKGVKEVRYHLEHAADWVIRLGDGTDESHRRAQAALDALWTYTGELFESDEVTRAVADIGFGVDPQTVRADWDRTIDTVLAEATLERPAGEPRPGTGRRGVHSEHLGYLLAEMQYLHRLHPGAVW